MNSAIRRPFNADAAIVLVLLLVPTSFVLLDLVGVSLRPQEKRRLSIAQFLRHAHHSEARRRRPARESLVLLNGTTIHGSQFTSPERRGQPTSYYGTPSGIGRVLNFFRANRPPGGVRIADVGLGTGTLAAYVTKGDYLTFYEINPAVIEMATSGQWFTYVADCRARGASATSNWAMPGSRSNAKYDHPLPLRGGARKGNLPRYHVLVLDAFSGDAVPTHLLTAEAYDIYLQRLATAAVDGADGALIVHVSNRYLDLSRVVRAAAEKLGLQLRGNSQRQAIRSNSSTAPIGSFSRATKRCWRHCLPSPTSPAEPPKPPVLWTDARSSLFEIVR